MSSKLPVVQHSLDQYMLEVGRVPLLTREEERELAQEYHSTRDVEAARKLVAANLRFVVKVAFQYKNYDIRMTDLIQEGNVGLMHAVSKYEPDRGYRLISYAVWWIKAYIQNYIIKNWSMVPISARRKHLFGKKRSLPSGEIEVVNDADASKPDGSSDTHFLVTAENAKTPVLGVSRKEMDIARRDFSLDATISDDGSVSHLSRLPALTPSPEESLGASQVRNEVTKAIGKVLEGLDDRGRYIVENRLVSDDPMSLAEIGAHFGVSRERARQLEARIKKKIKKALAHLGEAELRS